MERRAWGSQGLEVRSEEERVIGGTLVPYGSPTKIGGYTEEFRSGAFDGADPEQIPLLTGHAHAQLPIGRTLSLTDTPSALVGEWRVSTTQAGDEVMALARDGVPLSLSIGFRPTQDQWSRDRTHVVRAKATLGEVSVVGVGAYTEAKVTSVRADEQVSNALDTSPRLHIARLLR